MFQEKRISRRGWGSLKHGTAKPPQQKWLKALYEALPKAVCSPPRSTPPCPCPHPLLLPSALPQPKPPSHPPQQWLVLDHFYEKCRKHFIIWITPVTFNNYSSHQTQLLGQSEIWVSFQSPWNMKPASRQEKEGDIRSLVGFFLKEKGEYPTRLILSLYEFLHDAALRWNS